MTKGKQSKNRTAEKGIIFQFASLNVQDPPSSPRFDSVKVSDPEQTEPPLSRFQHVSHESPIVTRPPFLRGSVFNPHFENLADLKLLIMGILPPQPPLLDIGPYVSLDCEMVGVGPLFRSRRQNSSVFESRSSLARVSIVNYYGHVLLDTFVQQREPVTDYRTAISGVRPEDVIGPLALPFSVVRNQVISLLRNRILVGHAVHNDLRSLRYSHPSEYIRDTQQCPQVKEIHGPQTIGLKTLCNAEFGIDVQPGEHSSITDARAAMALFRLYRTQWEASLATRSHVHWLPNPTGVVDTRFFNNPSHNATALAQIGQRRRPVRV